MRETRVTAHAKLTLSLHVTGTRADGYHELDATMVSLSAPHDVLTIRPARRMSLTVDGPFAGDVAADASNLAWRAAEAAGATVAIELHKGIPPGGGLGGGSADAAAVLRVLGAAALAPSLGADVPFCLRGGFARVGGIGEVLMPGPMPELVIVVATPRFGCATPDVYRAWDALGGPHDAHNDLTAAADHVEPRLLDFRRAVEEAAGRPAIVAGSGSSCAVVFTREEGVAAGAARSRVEGAVDGSVWMARTVAAGVVVEPQG